MKHKRLLLLLAGCIGLTAFGQAPVKPFELELLTLNPGARSNLLLSTGDLLPERSFRVSLVGHYESQPLAVYDERDDTKLGYIVDARTSGHVTMAISVARWLEIGAQVPYVFSQTGDDPVKTHFQAVGKRGLGTPYFQFRFGIMSEYYGDAVDLGLHLGAALPLGSEKALTRDLDYGFNPRIGVGRSLGAYFRLGAEVGALFRTKQKLADTSSEVGNYMTAGLALSSTNEGLRFELGGRAFIPLVDAPLSGEAFAGLRWGLPNNVFEVFAMGAKGFGKAPGTPNWRVLGGIAVSTPGLPACIEGKPYEIDRCPSLDYDGDGVKNGEDACPTEPGIPEEKGCPAKDTDGDGVFDHLDKCPEVPGLPEYDGCPPPDADGDGIPDNEDACPYEPGPVSNRGCPIRDSDGDGIPDDEDACPNEPGIPELKGCPDKDSDGDGIPDRFDSCPFEPGPPENNGCKKKSSVTITRERLVISDKVYFNTGKATIQKRSNVLLNDIARIIKEHPEIPKLVIEGHTDSVGKYENNVKLSERRAEAVRSYLLKKGVEASRLEAKGFGPDRPIESNDTAAGRESNRRVEFVIVQPADKVETIE
ncbi:MAG: OmpA family protein [Proteobacteria bacterium]|nr:OmpA family protein [Cystobacterineae bacterium]MCL2258340.1 OmpA family protein [Cystobacterineae bacterium]MCL2315365.1 OmpA family protein [Pseudomonadota bacterium]